MARCPCGVATLETLYVVHIATQTHTECTLKLIMIKLHLVVSYAGDLALALLSAANSGKEPRQQLQHKDHLRASPVLVRVGLSLFLI